MPRVLQIIGGLGVGGAETWLLSLMRFWKVHGGPDVEFLLTNGREECLDGEVRALGAKLHYLPFSRRSPLSFYRGLRALLDSGQGFSVIHDHCDLATGLHFAGAGSSLPPVRIAHLHNHPALYARHYLNSPTRKLVASLGRRFILARATHVLATSRVALTGFGFGGTCRPETSVLHCGICAEDYRREHAVDRAALLAEFNWPSNSRVALCVGRLDRSLEFPHPENSKNTAFALQVARAAMAAGDQLRLLMVGEGPTREQFEARVAEWGLSHRIRFAGMRRDVPALMSAADVLLFPSSFEALGMAAVEAQAAGLAVLASMEVSPEAVIMPERFRALDLRAPIANWGSQLIELAQAARPSPAECAAALDASTFSIRASALALEKVYGAGVRR